MRRRQEPRPEPIRPDACERTGSVMTGLISPAMRGVFLFVLTGLCGTTSWADRHQIYFAEPYSGKKVTDYQIELPVARDSRQGFAIPAQCEELTRAARQEASRWGTRQQRSIWHKVDRDCRYHAFLNRYDRASRDFVSEVDIWNAPLWHLLVEPRCATSDTQLGDPDCQPLPTGIPRISQLLKFTDSEAKQASRNAQPCRLADGIFRGWVVADPSGNHCIPDSNAPGFRVMSVDYADVNGDDMLDVVLRLVPLAPGTSRIPLILPLTRTSPDSALEIPAQLTMPSTWHEP